MDAAILKLVIVGLIFISGLCVFGIVFTASIGHEPPPTLGAIASTAAGALVGILVTPAAVAARNNQPVQQSTPPPANGQ